MADHEGNRAHRFDLDIAGKPYCSGCGLVRLRNDLTEWCIKRGCNYADFPGYRNALATLPERFRERNRVRA